MITRSFVLCLTCLALAIVAHVVTLLVEGDDTGRLGWVVFGLLVAAVAALLFPVADALWRVHLPHRRIRRIG
jgi:hypothetical protein